MSSNLKLLFRKNTRVQDAIDALPDKVLELDTFNSGSVIRSGVDVSAWNDLALSNDATQGVGANQPTYVANGLNNRPAIFFDRTNDQFLTISDDNSLDFDATGGSIYIVGQFDSYLNQGSAWNVLFGRGSALTGPGFQYTSSNKIRSVTGGGALSFPSSSINTPAVMSIIWDEPTTQEGFWKGNSQGTIASGPTDSTGDYRIGGDTTSVRYAKGYVGQILAFSVQHTTVQRQQVEILLSKKWGTF